MSFISKVRDKRISVCAGLDKEVKGLTEPEERVWALK